MGDEESVPKISSQNQFVSHPYGGKVIWVAKSRAVEQTLFLNEKSLPRFQQLLEGRLRLKHNNFVTLRRYTFDEKIQSPLRCYEKGYEVTIEYPYYETSLEDITRYYAQQRVAFPENKLIAICKTVVDCLEYLKRHDTCHGDIKASNILFDSNSVTKLVDSYLVHGGKTSYEIILEEPCSSKSLLSPEQLKLLLARQFERLNNIQSREIFSMGMVMLEIMSGFKAVNCYDFMRLQIKGELIQQMLKESRKKGYSEKFVELVGRCVALECQDRINFSRFLTALQK